MIVATCLQFLLIKVYQVTEKQFSTQFYWKDKVTKDLRILQLFIWKKMLNDCFFQIRRTPFWTECPPIRLVLVLWLAMFLCTL